MAVDTSAQTKTWTFVDGDWHEGNVPLLGPRSHAMWLGSTVFDGARWFENVAPDLDLHCQRVNRSAEALLMNGKVEAAIQSYQRAVDLAKEQEDGNLELFQRNLANAKSQLEAGE